MSPHAREQAARRAGRALALLAALACALLLASTAAGATRVDERQLRSWNDDQLSTAASRFDAEATRIGEQLLATDRQRDEIVGNRDAARAMLAEFLAESYKRGSSDAAASAVYASGSLAEAFERVRIAQAVADYHGGLIDSLDAAEGRLDVTQVERARLITRLAFLQGQLVDVRAEQGRRALIRQEHAERRAAERAEADERARAAARRVAAATTVPGMLVGAPTAAAFVAPGGPPTAAGIDAYLAGKGSPMAGQGAAFMASGQRWLVDPRLLVAIAGAESSFGQVTCGPNNAWGWACPNDPADFQTWAAGIDTVTRGLRNYYLDEGRTSVSLIQQKYCPVGAANDPTGLNSHWTDNVTKFLVEQGGNPSQVGPGPSGSAALQLPGFGLVAAD